MLGELWTQSCVSELLCLGQHGDWTHTHLSARVGSRALGVGLGI